MPNSTPRRHGQLEPEHRAARGRKFGAARTLLDLDQLGVGNRTRAVTLLLEKISAPR